jgi:hypothetical protein
MRAAAEPIRLEGCPHPRSGFDPGALSYVQIYLFWFRKSLSPG